MTKLSKNLVPIYELELSLGNKIERIDEPAGSKCPYAVIMRRHLNIVHANKIIGDNVKYWENRDPHYPIESGYVCLDTNHVIAGPLN